MEETGIRIIYFDGSYEDYDPVKSDNVVWGDSDVTITNMVGNVYSVKKEAVKEIAPYTLLNERGDNGCYIRIFNNKDHIRMVSDKEITEN